MDNNKFDLADFVNSELKNLKAEKKVNTADLRRISSKIHKEIKKESLECILDYCEDLLDARTWEMGVIAYDLAFKQKKNYTRETFKRFEGWLIKYIRGWGDCDDFCTHAFGSLLAKYNELFDEIIKWCKRPEFWMRRAAAVILIYPIQKDRIGNINPFEISDAIMNDKHDLVLKGYGWMLKEYGKRNPEKVKKYLGDNVKQMPRVSFRYALEKLDKGTRQEFMKL